jgi:hypothetical protein
MTENENKKEELKENFCPACVVIPIAMASGGIGLQDNGRNKLILWGSIIITILMIFIYIYYKYIKKCSTCTTTTCPISGGQKFRSRKRTN